jgi:hypothetical protein
MRLQTTFLHAFHWLPIQLALPDLFETGTENKSVIPTIAGAKEELKFAIKSVTPETTAFTINEATGQISVPEGNSLEISETPYVFFILVHQYFCRFYSYSFGYSQQHVYLNSK